MEKHQKRTPIKVVGIRPGETVHELMIIEAELPRTYGFRDLYVINSAISSFQSVQTARYVAEGQPLLPGWTAPTYSSKDAVVRGEELKRVLRDAGLV
jgi:FlaA1/EpsC-like NDP-sugar epimerase